MRRNNLICRRCSPRYFVFGTFFYRCHYLMSIILYDIIPLGVSKENASPFDLPVAARPKGECTEILPLAASASSEPTILKDLRDLLAPSFIKGSSIFSRVTTEPTITRLVLGVETILADFKMTSRRLIRSSNIAWLSRAS